LSVIVIPPVAVRPKGRQTSFQSVQLQHDSLALAGLMVLARSSR